MSELIQEFVTSGSQRLRVDRQAGVIRGVKLLGLASRNGRRYREGALVEAIGLYEGAKVNINHPKGHPLAPRDYQDRLGIVRGVRFRRGEGLFGDLHFNPRHALSEQLVWDAEHAPQNVGMSHNVLARTRQQGDETIVEAITKVQSIDLVADPATTIGLYESVAAAGSAAESATGEPPVPTLDSLTLEQLQLHRPDLVREIEEQQGAEVAALRHRLDETTAREAAARRRELVLELLQEAKLPPPGDGRIESRLVSSEFVDSLLQAPTDARVREMIDERAALVRSVWRLANDRIASRPKSADQLAARPPGAHGPVRSAREFAVAIRG